MVKLPSFFQGGGRGWSHFFQGEPVPKFGRLSNGKTPLLFLGGGRGWSPFFKEGVGGDNFFKE